jgi:hypothetical protein
MRLGGKMMVMVEAFGHRPRWQVYTDDAVAYDQRVAAEMRAALPVGGLLVCDLGVCRFLWCDDCTASARFCVTRRREKSASRTAPERLRRPPDRDESIQVGQDRSHPCHHSRRMVSVRGPGVWSRYLTNVLAPQVLSARQVCEWYRRRWRIEDACALTKWLWDWAYVWAGSTYAVPWQIDATLMFSAVLVTSCQPMAQALGEPLERISVERGLRAFSHDLVACLAAHATRLGIVKRRRMQHRKRQALEAIIGGDP